MKRIHGLRGTAAALLAILVAGWMHGAPKVEKVVPAAPPNRLIVYTYDAFPQVMQESVERHFKDEHDAETVFRRFDDTGVLFNQILIEKGDPQGDVVIGLDNTYLGRIFAEDLLVPYRPKDLKVVTQSLIVDPSYRAVPFDYGSVTLNYDSAKLAEPPTSWEELLDPKYKRKIILMNPATSSPGRNFLLFTIAEFGEDGYLSFWSRLIPNLLTVTAGWSEGYGLYTQGEAPIVLSYDTSPAYHIMYEGEERYRNIFLDGKAYAQIEVAGILNGAANPANGIRFMDYIVTEEFQSLIPANQIMYPVHPAVELPEAFRKIQRASQLVMMNENTVSSRIAGWLDAWEETMR